MATKTKQRIFALLDAIKADFPRRKMAAEALMAKMGLDESLFIDIAAPVSVANVPTFDTKQSMALTPMLKARFEYASSWEMAQEVWLSANEMASEMKKKRVKDYHRALRENWEGSAPMLFSDNRLTLFGITKGVPEDLIYLAWTEISKEPEVWVYEGLESHKFKNLEQYLMWCLERE
ncbi:MAG: hypothetical protein ACYC3I_22505 [Gemmataceae bacterium]